MIKIIKMYFDINYDYGMVSNCGSMMIKMVAKVDIQIYFNGLCTSMAFFELSRSLYCIRGLFGGDFNLPIWQIFIGSPNLYYLAHTK